MGFSIKAGLQESLGNAAAGAGQESREYHGKQEDILFFSACGAGSNSRDASKGAARQSRPGPSGPAYAENQPKGSFFRALRPLRFLSTGDDMCVAEEQPKVASYVDFVDAQRPPSGKPEGGLFARFVMEGVFIFQGDAGRTAIHPASLLPIPSPDPPRRNTCALPRPAKKRRS